MRKEIPSPRAVRSMFDYSEELGGLIWKRRPTSHFQDSVVAIRWNTRFAGKRAGLSPCTRRGTQLRYVSVKLYGVQYYEHHLVLAWHGKRCPDGLEVDHKDDNPRNNRIENLRFVSRSTNCRKQCKDGGVRFFRGRWMARITIEGKRLFLGNFNSESAAKEARRMAEPDKLMRPGSTTWEPCSKEAKLS